MTKEIERKVELLATIENEIASEKDDLDYRTERFLAAIAKYPAPEDVEEEIKTSNKTAEKIIARITKLSEMQNEVIAEIAELKVKIGA